MKKERLELLEFLFYVGGLALAIIATLFSNVGIFSVIHLMLGAGGCIFIFCAVLEFIEKCQKKYALPGLYTICILIFLCICIFTGIDLIASGELFT